MNTLLRRRVLITATGLGVVAVLGLLVTDDETTEEGFRAPGEVDVTTGSAEERTWRRLRTEAGPDRAAFPPPVVSTSDGWCLGFARLDFAGPLRPSVARCVSAEQLPDVGPDEMFTAISVLAGTDVWHLVGFGRPVDQVIVTTADGDVPVDRIHLDERHAVLRLPADQAITALEWADGRLRHRCTVSAPDAATSGEFCPRRPDG